MVPERVGFSAHHSEPNELWAAQSSTNQFESDLSTSNQSNSDYLIAKFNKQSGTLVLSEPSSLLCVRQVPNSLKRQSDDQLDQSYIQQRTNLGLAFGTKKAIRELNTQQRNKLDQNSFGTATGLSNLLQSEIATQSSSLPSTDQIEQSANLARPIPTPNLSATQPKQAYDLNQLIPPDQLAALDLDPIISAETFKDRHALFSFRRSRFIQNKLRQLFSQSATPLSTKDQTKLRMVYHLSCLFAFRQVATPNKDHKLTKQNLVDKLNAPPIIVDGLLSAFTELVTTNNDQKRKVTSFTQAKLLGYLVVLVLMIDNYSTDVGTIAADLGIGESKVQELFKSVGCALVAPSSGERDRLLELGIAKSPAEAKRAKKATLITPLQFPKERKSRAKR